MENWENTIIVLNGPCCSGKTTVADLLVKAIQFPVLRLGIDQYMAPTLRKDWGKKVGDPKKQFQNLISGYHALPAAIARRGNMVIFEHVFQEPDWLRDFALFSMGCRVFLIGFFCSEDELFRRNDARGAGEAGREHIRFQNKSIHVPGFYDLTLDTTTTPAEACSQRVIEYLDSGKPESFAKLVGHFGLQQPAGGDGKPAPQP
jgi:chloramphenicol 3-O-phosphotransferase